MKEVKYDEFARESAKSVLNARDLAVALKVLYANEREVVIPSKLFTFIFENCPPCDRFVREGEPRVHLEFGGFLIVCGDER